MIRTFTILLFCWLSIVSYAQAASDSTTIENDSIPLSVNLDGVTVSAQRQLIKQDIDRIGYDVQADNDSKTKSTLDMLRKVPMVTIDGDENILVRGSSNFKIYKNGHLDPSLSKNAKQIFKALPASSIKRIEVITDPGAREDAEGVNAILNIVMMDTRKLEGITGTLTGSIDTNGSPGAGAYLATQQGKAVISVDYGYYGMTKKQTQNDGYMERTYANSGNKMIVESHGKNPGPVHYGNINASLDIDTLNLLSASFGGYFYKLDAQGEAITWMLNPLGDQLYRYSERYWMPSYSHHSWNGRFDYQHKTLRPGEQFTLSYMLALTRQHSNQETTYADIVDVPFSYNGFMSKTRENFTEHTFQADYMRPLWAGHKLEVGAKYIDRRNKAFNTQDFYQEPAYPSHSTQFNHTTQVVAAYLDYMYNLGNWSARAGLRYEYSYLSGHYPDGKSEDFDRNLHDWVPQASVKYQFDERQSLKLSYTTSIYRPGITYLNPAVISTPDQVIFGNSRLSSVTDRSLALHYLYVGQRVTLQVVPMFRFVNNGINSLVYAEGNTRFATYDNNLRQRRWQLECYIQWKPFDKTTFVTNLNLSDNHLKNTANDMTQHCTALNYYANISQRLPWKLTLSGYCFGQLGHSSESIYAYARSWFRYGFSMQRSFLSEDRLTIQLNANAPFNKRMHYKTRTTQGDFLGWGDNVYAGNGQCFRVSVSFRFGSLKARVKKTDTTIENTDEMGGIKRGK